MTTAEDYRQRDALALEFAKLTDDQQEAVIEGYIARGLMQRLADGTVEPCGDWGNVACDVTGVPLWWPRTAAPH